MKTHWCALQVRMDRREGSVVSFPAQSSPGPLTSHISFNILFAETDLAKKQKTKKHTACFQFLKDDD